MYKYILIATAALALSVAGCKKAEQSAPSTPAPIESPVKADKKAEAVVVTAPVIKSIEDRLTTQEKKTPRLNALEKRVTALEGRAARIEGLAKKFQGQ